MSDDSVTSGWPGNEPAQLGQLPVRHRRPLMVLPVMPGQMRRQQGRLPGLQIEAMGEVRSLVFEPQAEPEEHHEGGDERSIPERGNPPQPGPEQQSVRDQVEGGEAQIIGLPRRLRKRDDDPEIRERIAGQVLRRIPQNSGERGRQVPLRRPRFLMDDLRVVGRCSNACDGRYAGRDSRRWSTGAATRRTGSSGNRSVSGYARGCSGCRRAPAAPARAAGCRRSGPPARIRPGCSRAPARMMAAIMTAQSSRASFSHGHAARSLRYFS